MTVHHFDKQLYQEIVGNAQRAAGVPWVQATQYLPESGDVVQIAWSEFGSSRMRRAARVLERLVGGQAVAHVVSHVDQNPWLTQLYRDGQWIDTTLRNVARQVVPWTAVRLAEMVGLRHTLGIPLRVEGRVAGALVFHSPHPLTERQRATGFAFTRQVELTVENILLSGRLASHVKQLEALQDRLIADEDRVKAEVAAELHGRVQTRLLITWRRLMRVIESLPPGNTVRSALEAIGDELDTVREVDVRGVSHRLVPPILAAGLYPALRFLATLYQPEMSVEVTTEPALDDRSHSLVLTDEMRLALYRVAEEALANAYHHGQAKTARINIVLHPERLTVMMRDDGRGFEVDRVEENLGMASMRARVRHLGGQLRVQSQPGQGTEVRVTLDLTPSVAQEMAALLGPDYA